ncbi:MAG: M56 family metallopeptidase [Planctomycetota bacterium]
MRTLLRFYLGDAAALAAMNALIQVTVVVALAWMLSRIFRRAGAAVRYGLWLSALAVVLLAPLVSVVAEAAGITTFTLPFLREKPVSPPAAAAPATSIQTVSEPVIPVSPHPAPVVRAETAPATPVKPASPPLSRADRIRAAVCGVFLVWAGGVLVMLVRLIHGFGVQTALRTSAIPLDDDEMGPVLADVKNALGVRALPPIGMSGQITGPICFGITRPMILLPTPVAGLLGPVELRDILVHECAHVLQRDHLVGLLQRIAEVVFWWHPFVWKANGELARAREEVCDNYVLRRGNAPGYAKMLLDLAEKTSIFHRTPAAVGLVHPRWNLEERVKGILDERRRLVTRMNTWMLGFTGMVFLAMAVVVAGCRAGEDVTKKTDNVGAGLKPAPTDSPVNDGISWGQPVNGLSVGVRLTKDRDGLRAGAFVRNEGDKPVTLCTYRGSSGWELVDEKGAVVRQGLSYKTGELAVLDAGIYDGKRKIIAPGETAALSSGSLKEFFGAAPEARARAVRFRYALTLDSLVENTEANKAEAVAYLEKLRKEGVWIGEAGSPAVEIQTKGGKEAENISWGQPVNGLQAGIATAGQNVFRAGESMNFAIHFENTGGKALRLDAWDHPDRFALSFESGERKEIYYWTKSAGGEDISLGEFEKKDRKIETIVFGEVGGFWKIGNSPAGAKIDVDALPAGEYLVKAKYQWGGDTRKHVRVVPQNLVPAWTGAVETGSIRIEVRDKSGAKSTVPKDNISWGQASVGLNAGLQCGVWSEKTEYAPNEVIKVTLGVRNGGKEAIQDVGHFEQMDQEDVQENLYLGAFNAALLEVIGPDGKAVKGRIANHIVNTRYSLASGQEQTLVIPLSTFFSFEKPGEYRIRQIRGKVSSNVWTIRIEKGGKEAENISWGSAVNGLQAGLSAKQAKFEAGKPVVMDACLMNAGNQPIKLPGWVLDTWSWKVRLVAQESKKTYTASIHPPPKPMPLRPDVNLQAGEKAQALLMCEFWNVGEEGKNILSKSLPPGKYVMTAACDVPQAGTAFWNGKVTTGPVEIEIVEPGRAEVVLQRGEAVGDCKIKTGDVYFWRDWMPVVDNPGPDGGSPLHAKVAVELDNSAGKKDVNLSWNMHVATVGNNGKFFPGEDPKARDTITVHAGKKLVVELVTRDGPYLKVGAEVVAALRFWDGSGKAALVRTATAKVERTD